MARIATIYSPRFRAPLQPCTMDSVRWMRVSEALARLGHRVDMVIPSDVPEIQVRENLYYVDVGHVRWDDYDVVKTLFHGGFNHLEQLGGDGHPLIISKLGSVVGSHDAVPGVHFFGEVRERLFATQQRIAASSRWITVLTRESAELWTAEHGRAEDLLLVPTGVEQAQPEVAEDPFAGVPGKIVVYIGNLYWKHSGQRAVNVLWQNRLTSIGRRLRTRGIRLFVIGPGESDLLDPDAVTHLGPISHEKIHAYHANADAGLVLAQGEIQHNESSKIYEYLRAGLPVVSETPVPNNHVIRESGLGSVAEFRNDDHICELIERAVHATWDRQAAIAHMLRHHTWDRRVSVYDNLIRGQGVEA